MTLQISQLSNRVVSQAFQEIFFHLSERNICRVVLLLNKGLQMLSNSKVTIQSCCLYLDTHLLPHLFDHSIVPLQKGDLTLHTALEQLLDVRCRKRHTTVAKDLIRRLYWEKQTFQLVIRCHCFTALTIQSALTDIPQLGVARELTTELGYGSTVGYPTHYRSLPRLVQSALFQIEQNLHFVCLHTLLFYGQSYPILKCFQLRKTLWYRA